MLCSNCGKKVSAANKFCENCGTPVPVPIVTEMVAATSKKNTEPEPVKVAPAPTKSREVLHELNLQAWAGWTWLVAKNYGTLSISETHLEHKMHKLWSSNFWSIVAKIFNWGFDWLTSSFVNEGSTDLRAINSVRIYKLDWLAWKAPILFIWSVGLPSVYFVSNKQIDEVEAFVETLKASSAKAKFVTKAGN